MTTYDQTVDAEVAIEVLNRGQRLINERLYALADPESGEAAPDRGIRHAKCLEMRWVYGSLAGLRAFAFTQAERIEAAEGAGVAQRRGDHPKVRRKCRGETLLDTRMILDEAAQARHTARSERPLVDGRSFMKLLGGRVAAVAKTLHRPEEVAQMGHVMVENRAVEIAAGIDDDHFEPHRCPVRSRTAGCPAASSRSDLWLCAACGSW